MKLNLSALAPAVKATASKTKVRPVIAVSNPEVIDALCGQLDELEVLEGSIDAQKRGLVEEVFEKWLALNAESGTYNGTVELVGPEGRVVQLSFKNAFTKVDSSKGDAIKEAVGKKAYDMFFREKVDAKLSFDAVPESKQQALVDGIAKLLGELGCTSALTLTSVIVPVDGFNEVRASKLTTAQNLALEGVQRTIASFKRKAVTSVSE